MKFQKTARHKAGFPPVVQAGSRVLILGSMPGEKSLEQQEYYAHPRNLFWTLIAALNNAAMPETYEQKKALLAGLNIALWDVCDACIREGSLDTAIMQEIPNDLDHFLADHPSIRTVAFNGRKAAALYRKYFPFHSGITYLTLPSTSPANAGVGMPDKKAAWLGLQNYLQA